VNTAKRVLPESRAAALSVVLLGLVLWAIAIGIPEYLQDVTSVSPLASCAVSILVLGSGVWWTSRRRNLSQALLLIVFPGIVGGLLTLGVAADAAPADSGWGAVGIALAFAIYLAAAAWRSSQAPSFVETDTRALERFELGSKPPAEFRHQRAFITVGLVAAWVVAVPIALLADRAAVEEAWGPLALEARVFVHTIGVLLGGVILLVFVGPATRRRPPTRLPVKTRLIRGGLFATAAIASLVTLWLR